MSDELDLENLTDADIVTLFEDLTYNGFDIDGVRMKVLNREDRSLDEIQYDVILCLTALAKAGNNITKLTKKVKNPKTGKNLSEFLRRLGVKKRAKSADDLTLPRIGIAFLAPYLSLRKLYADKIQVQIKSDLDVAFMDMVFCGIPDIWNMEEYQGFYIKFGKLISKEDTTEDQDDEEPVQKKRKTRSSSKRGVDIDSNDFPWVRIATEGHENDYEEIKESVISAIKKKGSMKLVKDNINTVISMVYPDLLQRSSSKIAARQLSKSRDKTKFSKKKAVPQKGKPTNDSEDELEEGEYREFENIQLHQKDTMDE